VLLVAQQVLAPTTQIFEVRDGVTVASPDLRERATGDFRLPLRRLVRGGTDARVTLPRIERRIALAFRLLVRLPCPLLLRLRLRDLTVNVAGEALQVTPDERG
jgi:hypothetical protein